MHSPLLEQHSFDKSWLDNYRCFQLCNFSVIWFPAWTQMTKYWRVFFHIIYKGFLTGSVYWFGQHGTWKDNGPNMCVLICLRYSVHSGKAFCSSSRLKEQRAQKGFLPYQGLPGTSIDWALWDLRCSFYFCTITHFQNYDSQGKDKK